MGDLNWTTLCHESFTVSYRNGSTVFNCDGWSGIVHAVPYHESFTASYCNVNYYWRCDLLGWVVLDTPYHATSPSLEVIGRKCDVIYWDGWSWIGQYHAMKPPPYVINLKYGMIICKKFHNFVKDSTMCPIVWDSFHGSHT